MAIKMNASTEEVVGGLKLFSGLTNVNVIAVNPTMAELHALDIKVKTEQNYNVTIGSEEYSKVVFWLKNNDSTFRLEVLLQDKARMSQTGKYQWINSIGQSTWSAEEPTYEWWKSAGQRKGYVGEETLINFVRAWANVANGDEAYFETMSAIAKGDTSEIKALVSVLKENQARVLVGVKDDKYQTVYTKYFGRIKPQRDDLFIKALNDDYGSFNADFNTDLQWGTHVPTISAVTPDSDVSENEDWGTEQKTAQDDLPF